MLEELLKFNRLGNKEDLLFFLFEGISEKKDQTLKGLRQFCSTKSFSLSLSFDGIIMLFKLISFIEIKGSKIHLNKKYFDKNKFEKSNYFENFHFFGHLINSMKEDISLKKVFNADNIRYNPILSQYYILDNRFPVKYFPIRNLLLLTGFFERKKEFEKHLIVKKEFTENFRKEIIQIIEEEFDSFFKISLEQLKTSLSKKEIAGKIAEDFALKYERNRLIGHPRLDNLLIISEEYCNAGYDIQSFECIDSIIPDRFIEVKSFEKEPSFFWSKNEIEKAKELKGKYYLYIIDRSKISNKNYKPFQIQDPFKKIFEDNLWKTEPESWKVYFD